MRNLQISLLSTVALSAFLIAPDAQAQTGIGFGALKRAFNMTELAGSLPSTAADDDIRGVVEIGGLLYVSGRNGGATSDHKVYIVNPATTTLLGSFSIPEPHQTSSQGARDLATDLAGNIIATGDEGPTCFDTSGNIVPTIQGNNGPITMPLDESIPPVPAVGNQGGALDLMDLFGARRMYGVAFDPSGDGNNGSLIVGDTSNAQPFLELRISSGKILKVINDGGAAAIDTEGLVFDPLRLDVSNQPNGPRNTLWTNSSGDFGGGQGLYELDYGNLTHIGGPVEGGDYSIEATGRFIESAPIQPGMNGRGFGSLNVFTGGDPGSPWGAAFDLISTSQQNRIDNGRDDDFIGFHRLHQFPGVPGDTEAFLAASKADNIGDNSDQVPFVATDSMLVQPGNRIFLNMEANGRPQVGAPVAAIIFNLPASANTKGVTPLLPLGLPGNFPELVAVSPFSIPQDLATTALLFGGSIDTTPPSTQGIQLSSAFGIPPVFATGDRFNSQFVYFEPNSTTLSLGASNEAGFLVVGINTIEFKMQAPSAFSVDLLDPFIQLREFGGGDASTSITKLIISTKNTANGAIEGAATALGMTGGGSTLPQGTYFDINEDEMADRFVAGSNDLFSGVMVGCNGTYRPIDPGGNPFTTAAPRSDVDVGLIYGDGLIDPSINTPYNLGRGDPDNLDPDTLLPDPILPPIDVTSVPPYHADAAMLTAYGRGDGDCFIEWWPQPPSSTAYPYQTGFLAADGQFGIDSLANEQPGYDPVDPDPQGWWLWWPQTLEFNFTPGAFLGKTFGFDMDIDGNTGGADSGGDLAGLFVEVHLNNGTMFSGLTLPDGTNPDVGIIGW